MISKLVARRLSSCVALCLSAAPIQAQPAPKVLEPETGWAVDYGEERCSLARKFSSNGDELWLRIDSYGSATNFTVQIVSSILPASQKPTGSVRVALMPAESEPQQTAATLGKAGDIRALSFRKEFISPAALAERQRKILEAGPGHPSAPDPAFDRAIEMLRLWPSPAGAPIDLKLGKMAEPIMALRTCVDDLLQSWGLDAARQRTLTREPAPPPPPPMKGPVPQGQIVFTPFGATAPARVMVNEKGEPTKCVVQSQSVAPAFAETFCKRMMAMKLLPALDANGQPVAGVRLTSIITP